MNRVETHKPGELRFTLRGFDRLDVVALRSGLAVSALCYVGDARAAGPDLVVQALYAVESREVFLARAVGLLFANGVEAAFTDADDLSADLTAWARTELELYRRCELRWAEELEALAAEASAEELPISHLLPPSLAPVFAALLALTGCVQTWSPESYPVDVVVLGEVSDAHQVAIISGLAELERATGEDLAEVRFEPDGGVECGRVHVVVTDELEANHHGETWNKGRGQCQATFAVRTGLTPGQVKVVVMHEFGHVMLGSGHSVDPRSVMNAAPSGAVTLTEEDIADLRDAVEATR